MRGATWKDQSKFTDPGKAGAVIDELPADLAALREASSQLVFHYRADGDWAENGVPAERAGEIDTRYADGMFALLLSRGEPALAGKRLPSDRIVGCCRDATWPGNWLRAVAWAGSWIAGFALMRQAVGPWGTCPTSPARACGVMPRIGSPAVVSWGELAVLAAWLVLGAVLTWVLAGQRGPFRRPALPT